MSISKHLRDKTIALCSVGLIIYACYSLAEAFVIEYPSPAKSQITKDWERENAIMEDRLTDLERLTIALNHRLIFVQDSLNREINVRDNFVYSLTNDTWQYYPAVWDVSQKYRSWVYFHANYDPTYFQKPVHFTANPK